MMMRRVGQTVILLGLIALVAAAWLRLQTMRDVADARLEMVSVSLASQEDEVEIIAETPTARAVQPSTDVNASSQTFDLSNVPVLQDLSISPALNPRTFQGKLPEHGEFETYVVQRGNTPVRIADRFGIQSETLLGGNPQLSEEAGLLQVDDEVIILPIDGVLHDVQPGDTLESLSTLYGIATDEIIGYEPNNLEFPFRLYADTQIMVPGAKREVFQWDPPTISNSGGYWAGQAAPAVVGTGSFVWPVSARRITQVYWAGHPGLDIGLPEGSGVFAADTGTVTYAAWSPYCYGNLIVINHGNGFETFYAHLNGINVVPGQIVFKGNVIGSSGNTGCSSGPHIHVEVRVNGRRDDPMWWFP